MHVRLIFDLGKKVNFRKELIKIYSKITKFGYVVKYGKFSLAKFAYFPISMFVLHYYACAKVVTIFEPKINNFRTY